MSLLYATQNGLCINVSEKMQKITQYMLLHYYQIFTFGFHSIPQDLRLDSRPYNNVSEAHDESDEHLANLFVCGRFQIHLFFLYNPMHATCFITGRWLWDTWLLKSISPVQCVSQH